MYDPVRNARELRANYEILEIFEELAKERPSEHADKTIRKVKAAIREYHRRPCDRRIIKDRGMDGYVELIELPSNIDTLDWADEYFRCKEYIYATPSQYDCTGQAFTSWYKVFRRRWRFMAYHSVCFDV